MIPGPGGCAEAAGDTVRPAVVVYPCAKGAWEQGSFFGKIVQEFTLIQIKE